MPIVTLSSGRTFDVRDDESILQGALRAGIALEYSCETGRCGTCRAGLVRGDTIPFQSEIGLTQAELAESQILICARNAVGDVAIDMEDFGDLQLPQRKIVPCRIDQIQALTGSICRVVLRLPPTAGFAYLDGQYVDVTEPGQIRRSYSIANAMRADGKIELHIRKVDGGQMSAYWFERAKVNDLLRLSGPFGTFFMRDVTDRDVVFLATGTGIAPVKAMLEARAALSPEHSPRSIHVYWGGRIPSDFYWDPNETGVSMVYHPVLSRSDPFWAGRMGYVQDMAVSSDIELGRAAVYACGSPAMIDSARETFVRAGLNPSRFLSDAFVSSDKARS